MMAPHLVMVIKTFLLLLRFCLENGQPKMCMVNICFYVIKNAIMYTNVMFR